MAVSGLTGGHSGSEINKGRANANMLLGRLLEAAAAAGEMRLVGAQGGMKDNAIPVAAEAVVAVADAGAVRTAVEQLGESLKHEYHVTEPALTIAVTEAAEEEVPMDQASTDRALCLLSCVPNGVQAMSMDLPGLVQTSLNLGVLRTEASVMTATFCVRSSVSSQKEMLHSRLKRLMDQLGGTLRITGDYPAWEYRTDSPLRERMVELFREQYGKGAPGRSHPRRRGVRYSERQAAGAGLCVHRPESDGDPHPAGADGDRLRPAGVAVHHRIGSPVRVMFGKKRGRRLCRFPLFLTP